MEIDREEMAEKAGQIAGQAKELLSKVDTEKAMGATNKFMTGMFKFGKIVSALFMLLCIVAMLGALLYCIFAGPDSLEVPEFKAVSAAMENSGGDWSGDVVQKQEYRKVRDKFSKKIDAIVDLYRLNAKDDTDDLLNSLCEVPEEYRSDFVNGALSFGKDAKKYYAKNKPDYQVDDVDLARYTSLFSYALAEKKESEVESRMNRQAAWTVCGGAFLGLIMFLFLPLLIQIEENTRK